MALTGALGELGCGGTTLRGRLDAVANEGHIRLTEDDRDWLDGIGGHRPFRRLFSNRLVDRPDANANNDGDLSSLSSSERGSGESEEGDDNEDKSPSLLALVEAPSPLSPSSLSPDPRSLDDNEEKISIVVDVGGSSFSTLSFFTLSFFTLSFFTLS